MTAAASTTDRTPSADSIEYDAALRRWAESTTSTDLDPQVGDEVRIKKGLVGEGYKFWVKELETCGLGKSIVYGTGNFGPRWASEVEVVRPLRLVTTQDLIATIQNYPADPLYAAYCNEYTRRTRTDWRTWTRI